MPDPHDMLPIEKLASSLGGGPLLGVVLGPGPAVKLPPSTHWLVVSAETLAGARLAAGQTVMVAITNRGTNAGPGTPGRAPASPLTPTSAFAPIPAPDLRAPGTCVRSLWSVCSTSYNLQLEDSSAGITESGQWGQYTVVARVWAAARMPRGSAMISPALSEACGVPPHGTALALFPLAPRGHVSSSPNSTSTSGAVSGGVPTASRVVLRVCRDRVKYIPAVLPQQQPQVAAGGSTAAAGLPSTPLSRQGSTGSTRKGAPSTPGAAAGAAAAAAAVNSGPGIGSWVLQVLGSDLNSGSSGSVQLSAQQRALLDAAAAHAIGGRALARGNPVPLPLLGHTLLCRVEHVGVDAAAGSSHKEGEGQGPALSVLGTTQVELKLPGERAELKVGEEAGSAGAADGSSGVLHSGGSTAVAAAGGREAAALVARARKAAEDACTANGGSGSSGAEAAAAAAERAVLAGLSACAGGRGFASLGGVSGHAAALRELVALPLRAGALFAAARLRPPRGVLLHGPPGSGKTVLAVAAAQDAGATLLTLNGPDVISEFYGESEAGLRGVFAAARALAPSVVFIDEIDALAPARGGGGGGDDTAGVAGALSGAGGGGGGAAGGAAARVVTALLTLLDGASSAGPGDGVVVVGATNRPAALDPALRRPGRLERELEVGPPGAEGREAILRARLLRVAHSLSDDQVRSVAAAAHGCVGADLAALVDAAALGALRRYITAQQQSGTTASTQPLPKLEVSWEDMAAAQSHLKPSALRELAVEVPRVRWSDVGGLDDVKASLREAVEWPFAAPAAFERLGARPPRGVLLYGPPGCSKTLLARAVAAEAGLNFLAIKGAELVSKYVGESEKAVAGLFARARATAPCVVFFDELDGLARARDTNGAGGGMSDRVMSQLLTEMDGLQARVGVVVLAATNRPDAIDAALLRPGRFDRLVYVPPPDGPAREAILRVQLRATPCADDVDVGVIAVNAVGYTGADLAAVAREAGLAALAEDVSATQVAARHFEAALALVPPSAPAPAALYRLYSQFQARGSRGVRGLGTCSSGAHAGSGDNADGGVGQQGGWGAWKPAGELGPEPVFSMGAVA